MNTLDSILSDHLTTTTALLGFLIFLAGCSPATTESIDPAQERDRHHINDALAADDDATLVLADGTERTADSLSVGADSMRFADPDAQTTDAVAADRIDTVVVPPGPNVGAIAGGLAMGGGLIQLGRAGSADDDIQAGIGRLFGGALLGLGGATVLAVSLATHGPDTYQIETGASARSPGGDATMSLEPWISPAEGRPGAKIRVSF